jgi:hypothetical protein
MLREVAFVQGVESSNRLDGVEVRPDRLHPLVTGNATPRDRPEEEICNYRDALELVNARGRTLKMTPAVLVHLHRMALKDCEIDGWQSAETAKLCNDYRRAYLRESIPPLVAVAGFILDVLCLRPFKEGNGRIARLLMLLGLYRHGYEVGRYVSVERRLERAWGGYHEALEASSAGWEEGENDLLPWLDFFLSVLREAYQRFQDLAEDLEGIRGTKTARIVVALSDFARGTSFSLGSLIEACPGIHRDMVRRVLWELQNEGKVESLGRGPGALWRRVEQEKE